MTSKPLGGGPTPLDFSETAARKAALSDTIQHPMTLGPVAIGTVAAFGLGVFSVVSAPAVVGIAAAGLVLGGTNWAYRFFVKGSEYSQKYFARINEAFEDDKKARSSQLAVDLRKLGCKRGQEQVGEFEGKFKTLVDVLRRVLSEGELTYDRFVGTAQQVYRSGLENLERIVTLLISIDDIDRDDIQERLKRLESKTKLTKSEEITLGAVRDQIVLCDRTTQEVEELLAKNDQALAMMDRTGSAAIRTRDNSSQDPKEIMEQALEQLRSMVARADNKAKGPSIVLGQNLKP